MSIIVATDSASGITPEEAKALNIPILPIPFIINEKEYFQNVNLSNDMFYEMLSDDKNHISTSQPAMGTVIEFWNQLLKEYDQVIYITLSSALSGSCSSCNVLCSDEDYEGKVFCPDLQRISVTQRQAVLDAQALIAQGKTAEEVVDTLMDMKLDAGIYITLDTLKYLVKGGRLTPAAGLIGNVLNLKPILQIQGEKLDAFAKCRGLKKSLKIMLDAVEADLNGRFKEYKDNGEMYLQIAHTNCYDRAMELKEKMHERFPDMEIYVTDLSLEIACHTGPGALGVASMRRI